MISLFCMMKTRKKSLIAHFRARACRFEDCLVPPVSMSFMTLIYSNIYVGIIDIRVNEGDRTSVRGIVISIEFIL